jgi:hypothetical protein
VDIVRVQVNNHSQTCARHDCCGNQVEREVKVKVKKERMKYRGDKEDDVLQNNRRGNLDDMGRFGEI